MTCTRCGRRLKNISLTGMGPICARAVLGTKPRAITREVKRDERTPDMFADPYADMRAVLEDARFSL